MDQETLQARTSPRPGWVVWLGLGIVLAAAAVLSFDALRGLGLAVGIPATFAWLVPVVVDGGAAVSCAVWLGRRSTPDAARIAGKLTWALLAVTVLGNAAQLAMAAHGVVPPWWVAAVVGAVPPAVVGATVHLVVLLVRPGRDAADHLGPAEVEEAERAAGVPVVVPDWRASVPTHLYRLYAEDEQLLYVGITMDVPARLSAHRTEKTWWPEVARAQVSTYQNRPDALAAERVAIAEERPAHNAYPGSRGDLRAPGGGPDYAPGGPVATPVEVPVPQQVSEPRPASPRPAVPPERAGLADDQIADRIREWSADPDRTGPTRNAVMREFGIGASRATKLLEQTGPRRTA